MKLQAQQRGWVILSNEGTFMLEYTYSRTRTEAIKKYRKLWAKPLTWDAYKKNGYSCVRAIRTIAVE